MAGGWRGFFVDGGMVMVFDGSFDGGGVGAPSLRAVGLWSGGRVG